MTQKPLIDVQFHANITSCEFLDHHLTARSDMLIIFRYLDQRVNTHPGIELILDFKNVNHISSIFIGFLMDLRQRTLQNKGEIVLAQVNDQVYEILELTQITQYFPVHRIKDHECNPVSRLNELRYAAGQTHPTMITRIMSMVHHIHFPDLLHHHDGSLAPPQDSKTQDIEQASIDRQVF
ncbi:MAG: STAS domain-containing protein [Phycisphaeraceae bacterium]|nr:STAS domain-containing protein [Phycisphaeraceae bacterium]